MTYNIKTLTKQDVKTMQEEAWGWENGHGGNWYRVMIEKSTGDIWLQVFTEDNYSNYATEDGDIQNLSFYMEEKMSKTLIEAYPEKVIMCAKRLIEVDFDENKYFAQGMNEELL